MAEREDKEKPAEEKKKKERKGKKKHKNQPASQRWKKYKIDDNKITREKTCPRCGLGIFLMKTKDRLYCGKCHLTEFISKEKPAEEAGKKPAEKPVEEKK